MPGRLRRVLGALPHYARLAWQGAVGAHLPGRRAPVILQAVVRDGDRVLLAVRDELHGWELPGGAPEPGEPEGAALRRELREETGLEVLAERFVGEYVRSGFRPHVARVWLCRPCGGALRPSPETPRLQWFAAHDLPRTLFPWHRGPLQDALRGGLAPALRRERNGVVRVLAGLAIDLRMRWSDDRAA
jgi:8-oxo-dGTP pyrophosphatase MutT (NUDIX family)